jgi:hypothetical protein
VQPIARILAAVLVLAGGAVHLDLWHAAYRVIPYIGPLFLVNVIASVLVAAAVLIRFNLAVLIAGVALAAGSLGALVLSRTVGVFGFMESGLSVEALATIAAELGASVTLCLVLTIRNSQKMVPARAVA